MNRVVKTISEESSFDELIYYVDDTYTDIVAPLDELDTIVFDSAQRVETYREKDRDISTKLKKGGFVRVVVDGMYVYTKNTNLVNALRGLN